MILAEEDLSHYEFHMDRFEMEPGRPRWEADDRHRSHDTALDQHQCWCKASVNLVVSHASTKADFVVSSA